MKRRTFRLLLVALALASPAWAQMRLVPYASGFATPIAIVQHPTDAQVQFVVEQGGRIRVVRSGAIVGDFLNIGGPGGLVLAGGERGLLGLAFAPDYATSGRFFVNYTRQPDGHTVVSRYTRSSNPLVADPASRFDLLWSTGLRHIVQPFANHNGGWLAFGPDGFLYIGMGDGGSGNDPNHAAQTPGTLLGKMLRVDVNVPNGDPAGFRIPADNPFVSRAGYRPEIWAFGLRNPWRFSFDDVTRGGTGAMFIGDVGQGAREEIDYQPPGRGGRNYGWRNREGTLDNVQTLPPAFTPLIDPMHDYNRTVGASVTGGYVYRGRNTQLRGRYFFGDFISGRVFSLRPAINASTGEATAADLQEHTTQLNPAGSVGNVSSFGVDAAGELFIVTYAGTIFRLVVAPSAPTNLRIIR
jgi:glucose/arabinose dehydrogenase